MRPRGSPAPALHRRPENDEGRAVLRYSSTTAWHRMVCSSITSIDARLADCSAPRGYARRRSTPLVAGIDAGKTRRPGNLLSSPAVIPDSDIIAFRLYCTMLPHATDDAPIRRLNPASDQSSAAHRALLLAQARALTAQAALVRSSVAAVRSCAVECKLRAASLVAESAVLRHAIASERLGLRRSTR